MTQKWNFLSSFLRECSGWGGHQHRQWENLGLCKLDFWEKDNYTAFIHGVGKSITSLCRHWLIWGEGGSTQGKARYHRFIRYISYWQRKLLWPGGSTDSGGDGLRSTILSNYLFTESEGGTFSPLLGLYEHLLFKYHMKALSSTHL